MVWALNCDVPADGAAKLILLALANEADSRGRNASPTREELAQRALCSVKTVDRKLADLAGALLIKLGDQRRVRHLRADRRPIVYDLAGAAPSTAWLESAQAQLDERARAAEGRAFARAMHPASVGVEPDRGVTESPREGHGASQSRPVPASRGVTESPRGEPDSGPGQSSFPYPPLPPPYVAAGVTTAGPSTAAPAAAGYALRTPRRPRCGRPQGPAPSSWQRSELASCATTRATAACGVATTTTRPAPALRAAPSWPARRWPTPGSPADAAATGSAGGRDQRRSRGRLFGGRYCPPSPDQQINSPPNHHHELPR